MSFARLWNLDIANILLYMLQKVLIIMGIQVLVLLLSIKDTTSFAISASVTGLKWVLSSILFYYTKLHTDLHVKKDFFLF